tara:strand:+ start:58849 stop:59691 length:843 start_codon:yes stop_codon:yes gene_type:complete
MIEIKKAGLHTSVQDEGRYFFRSSGIPVSGAMDQEAFRFANFLLENELNTPVLEFTQIGPTLYFHARTSAVLTGAKFNTKLNGRSIRTSTPFEIPADSILQIGNAQKGNYGYLSIKGGFHAHDVLGSASYCPSINEAAMCKEGNTFVYVRSRQVHATKFANVNTSKMISDQSISVEPGPEFDVLSLEQKNQLAGEFTISRNSSRMAIQLDHDFDLKADDILTAPVQPGTVQLTPGGDLIVLMRDAQTTGGYARILQLSQRSINRLAQVRPGSSIELVLNK